MNSLKCFTVLLLILIYQLILCNAGVFSWLFGSSGEQSSSVLKDPSGNFREDIGRAIQVPFEMKTTDEKFLAEAQKYGLQLSGLDVCNHKVIMHLKKSCGTMTEEDIGRVSVMLLNCQSAVEGRPVFRCTDDMTLRDCTKDMDQNTWNAYHIVSNRARAVCYAARQQQFTAKTEITVNKLMWTAENQLDSMKKLEEGQEKMGDLTSRTLETMATGQKDLMSRQEILKSSQQKIQLFIMGNMRELTREKALIATGQKELAEMTEVIKKKLDTASNQLERNEVDRQKNHQEILDDLAAVQKKSEEVWNKIDKSTQQFLQNHEQTVNQYQETLENLKRINETAAYLLALVDKTRREVDEKINWLAGLMDGAGDQLSVMYTCTLHGIYFLITAIGSVFLQTPTFSRIILLLLITLNVLSDVRQGVSLDFIALTVILVSVVLLNWMVIVIYSAFKMKKQLNGKYLNSQQSSYGYPALKHQSDAVPNGQVGKAFKHNSSQVEEEDFFSEDDEIASKARETSLASKSSDKLIESCVRRIKENVLKHTTQVRRRRNSVGRKDLSTGALEPEVSTISHHSSFQGLEASIIADTPHSTPGSSTPKSMKNLDFFNSELLGSPFPPTKAEVDGVRKDLLSILDNSGRPPSCSSSLRSTPTRSRGSTPSIKKSCSGINREGQPCKATSMLGKDFCHHHINQAVFS
ncbi:protein brambleberry-like isoform X2 [Tachypleus tridentatus]|uniref:protein brambleberry-like isoform X2 n=1 Tax=Tachypleus tridentatus TaxID=6853 RepID=UPI003FD447DA